MSRNPTLKKVIVSLLCFTVVAAVTGQATAEARTLHTLLFARPAFADASAMVQQLPKPNEKPRLYLCNTGDGPIKDQELSGTRQKATSGGVWASILHPEFKRGFCEWKGRVPFSVKTRQLELWLLIGTPKAKVSGTVVLKVRILRGDSIAVEHEIELPPKWQDSRDSELVEVLERWDVDELNLKQREELTVQFASKTPGFSIIGYGVSHLTFRDTPRTPSPQTAMWLRSQRKEPETPSKVRSKLPNVAGASGASTAASTAKGFASSLGT